MPMLGIGGNIFWYCKPDCVSDESYRAKEQGDVEEIVFCREELLEALLWTVYMCLTKKIVRNELESSILAWNNLLLNE